MKLYEGTVIVIVFVSACMILGFTLFQRKMKIPDDNMFEEVVEYILDPNDPDFDLTPNSPEKGKEKPKKPKGEAPKG